LIEIGIRYRRTHDLAELVQLVQPHDQPIPPTPILLSRLTAFAVQFRYEELPGDLALVPAEARDTSRSCASTSKVESSKLLRPGEDNDQVFE